MVRRQPLWPPAAIEKTCLPCDWGVIPLFCLLLLPAAATIAPGFEAAASQLLLVSLPPQLLA